MRSFFRVQFQTLRVLHALSVCLALGSILAFLSWAWWPFEILSHFRLQTMVLCLVAVIVYLLKRKLVHAFLLAICVLLNFSVVLPHLFFFGVPQKIGNYPDNFKIMHLNVDLENLEFDKVIAYIRQEQPDFVLLEEIDENWEKRLEVLFDDYPHAFTVPRQDSFGFAFYSKAPLIQPSLFYFDSSEVPAMITGVNLGRETINVVGMHTVPPSGNLQLRQRNEQFFTLAKILSKPRTRATMVIGDLNATPWSYAMEEMVESGRLHNALNSSGVFGTWPCNNWAFRIPVDHCLVSDRIVVLGRNVGPDVGSEHLPLVVKFAVEKESGRRIGK
ncbi:MAG: hypothetical protein JWM04_354 [Verrucomicrobiales bacterium]|nr:hypothetical protein [Verrucomicrobiales bacterium]